MDGGVDPQVEIQRLREKVRMLEDEVARLVKNHTHTHENCKFNFFSVMLTSFFPLSFHIWQLPNMERQWGKNEVSIITNPKK